jgi:hypothetical protein
MPCFRLADCTRAGLGNCQAVARTEDGNGFRRQEHRGVPRSGVTEDCRLCSRCCLGVLTALVMAGDGLLAHALDSVVMTGHVQTAQL